MEPGGLIYALLHAELLRCRKRKSKNTGTIYFHPYLKKQMNKPFFSLLTNRLPADGFSAKLTTSCVEYRKTMLIFINCLVQA